MNLQQLRYVVATAEHRTMTDAAKSLYIAQPALSRAIRDLERELGMTLFARSGRGVVVTPEGRKVVRLAREALGAVQQIADLAASVSGGAGAELRIATTPALQPGLARVLVPRYNEEHPAVRVVPVPCEGRDAVVNAIRRQRAELGLTDLPVPPDLVGRPVKCQEMVLIAAADWNLPEPVPLSRLNGMKLILPPPGTPRRRELDQLLAHHRVVPAPAPEPDERIGWVGAVRSGQAALLGHRGLSEQAKRAGLAIRSLDPPIRKVIAIVHARRRLPTAAQNFLALVERGSAA
ncbi:LysR family transcriptional regulator [Thermopolyspora flexuosa]|jgi:DNA-binding transcriptional LysR family regulator|uniref:DNA-binding transcriptional LysR family regulator n=1 Tax=Thermopolyspora flexuosa TaxID=103836 RepID=A0A543IYR3_9ACTN|nr:LysR family transcriptional regulator [Thermopolyspora flexuosa]TQM75719.1 DNA-binding transcriptional LysR family regulator [Thermopolyspora flexuosa]